MTTRDAIRIVTSAASAFANGADDDRAKQITKAVRYLRRLKLRGKQ